ncbi:MAG: hypothetical protein GVY19_02865 [Bacteroidetes bacterium]|jgi:C-terminal processing protease CtpA/Prc|nr:hypothetical protein [Bacteroidota bacterium]
MRSWVYILLILTVAGCEESDEDQNSYFESDIEIVNTDIYQTMKDIYLWYEYLPNINPKTFASPYELMDTLKHAKDRYSYVVSQTEFLRYYEEGKSTGHGFGLASDANKQLYIAYVYKNTPAYYAGVKRGWKIETVNETDAYSNNYQVVTESGDSATFNTFTFRLPNDSMVTRVIEKKEIDINPVILDTVYTYGDRKIGYLVFQEFINVANDYLNQAFQKFNQQQINYLVVDLRYNGGGFGHVVEHLGNLIAGSEHAGDVFYQTSHNNNNQDKNQTVKFESVSNSLSVLQEIYFISTINTVSASELLMNGMSTHYPTTFIGTVTHGKPVGMYVYNFKLYDYTFAPVSFRVENSEGFADYFDGLPADYEIPDNLNYDFGDINEPNLNKALQLIGVEVSLTDENTLLKSSFGEFNYLSGKDHFRNLYFKNFVQ